MMIELFLRKVRLAAAGDFALKLRSIAAAKRVTGVWIRCIGSREHGRRRRSSAARRRYRSIELRHPRATFGARRSAQHIRLELRALETIERC